MSKSRSRNKNAEHRCDDDRITLHEVSPDESVFMPFSFSDEESTGSVDSIFIDHVSGARHLLRIPSFFAPEIEKPLPHFDPGTFSLPTAEPLPSIPDLPGSMESRVRSELPPVGPSSSQHAVADEKNVFDEAILRELDARLVAVRHLQETQHPSSSSASSLQPSEVGISQLHSSQRTNHSIGHMVMTSEQERSEPSLAELLRRYRAVNGFRVSATSRRNDDQLLELLNELITVVDEEQRDVIPPLASLPSSPKTRTLKSSKSGRSTSTKGTPGTIIEQAAIQSQRSRSRSVTTDPRPKPPSIESVTPPSTVPLHNVASVEVTRVFCESPAVEECLTSSQKKGKEKKKATAAATCPSTSSHRQRTSHQGISSVTATNPITPKTERVVIRKSRVQKNQENAVEPSIVNEKVAKQQEPLPPAKKEVISCHIHRESDFNIETAGKASTQQHRKQEAASCRPLKTKKKESTSDVKPVREKSGNGMSHRDRLPNNTAPEEVAVVVLRETNRKEKTRRENSVRAVENLRPSETLVVSEEQNAKKSSVFSAEPVVAPTSTASQFTPLVLRSVSHGDCISSEPAVATVEAARSVSASVENPYPALQPFSAPWPAICQKLRDKAPRQFRGLAQLLAGEKKSAGRSIVAFCGFEKCHGTTTLLLETARELAAYDHRVLLIDMNLDNPELLEQFGVVSEHGWEYLLSPEVFGHHEPPLLHLLPERIAILPLCREKVAAANTFLAEYDASDVVKHYLHWFDHIVIDAGSVDHRSHRETLMRLSRFAVEAILLVRNPKITSTIDHYAAFERLTAKGPALLGIAENYGRPSQAIGAVKRAA